MLQNEILQLLEVLETPVGFMNIVGNPKTYIIFDIYKITPIDFSDDDSECEEYKIQFDIFTLNDPTELHQKLKELLKENDFKLTDSAIMYEIETKLNHVGLRYTKVK